MTDTTTKAKHGLCKIRRAAALLDVSDRTMRRMCEDGQVKAVKVRRDWRVNEDALRAQFGIEA